jgi:hypothetical protein
LRLNVPNPEIANATNEQTKSISQMPKCGMIHADILCIADILWLRRAFAFIYSCISSALSAFEISASK